MRDQPEPRHGAEQLAVAERHRDYHRKRCGHQRSNVHFIEGRIEQLDALGLPPGSFDLIVSNYVISKDEARPCPSTALPRPPCWPPFS